MPTSDFGMRILFVLGFQKEVSSYLECHFFASISNLENDQFLDEMLFSLFECDIYLSFSGLENKLYLVKMSLFISVHSSFKDIHF
jgi:hypothetical protein